MKKTLILILSIICIVSLTACGKGNKNSDSSNMMSTVKEEIKNSGQSATFMCRFEAVQLANQIYNDLITPMSSGEKVDFDTKKIVFEKQMEHMECYFELFLEENDNDSGYKALCDKCIANANKVKSMFEDGTIDSEEGFNLLRDWRDSLVDLRDAIG